MVQSVYKKLIALLKEAGCTHLREAKGSHEIWITTTGKRLVIPHNLKGVHLANQILKDAGLKKAF
jgi:predicted RNA binding protein YcfA (HicA-like mRNA interferase family)